MINSPIITSFPLRTLTTKTFRWLHQEGWDAEHYQYFAACRETMVGQIFLSPHRAFKRKTRSAERVGSWVFSDYPQPTEMSALAELHYYPQKFATYHLLFARLPNASVWLDTDFDALSLLVSAVFIAGNADVIQLLTSSGEDARRLSEQGWGDMVQAWTFAADPILMGHHSGLVSQPILVLSSSTWWHRDVARRDQDTLSYLSKRTNSIERPKPRRSWLRRRR